MQERKMELIMQGHAKQHDLHMSGFRLSRRKVQAHTGNKILPRNRKGYATGRRY